MITINVVKITYLTLALAMANCAEAHDKHRTVSNPSVDTSQSPARSRANERNPSASEVMNNVMVTYSKIVHYKGRGLTEYRRSFDGELKDESRISFDVDYMRGNRAVLRWIQDNHQKVLTIDGKESWLDLDGRREQKYLTARDALMTAPHADGGWSFFHLRIFVLREELQLDDKFFAGLLDPRVIGEDVVDGRSCLLLKGSYRGADVSQTYWIDKESYLIRRIEQSIVTRKQFEGKEYVSTATTTESHSEIEIRSAGDGSGLDL